MSALPPKADIRQHDLDVRFVPKADIAHLLDYLVSPSKERFTNRLRDSLHVLTRPP
jgi:hypothetical protein